MGRALGVYPVWLFYVSIAWIVLLTCVCTARAEAMFVCAARVEAERGKRPLSGSWTDVLFMGKSKQDTTHGCKKSLWTISTEPFATSDAPFPMCCPILFSFSTLSWTSCLFRPPGQQGGLASGEA